MKKTAMIIAIACLAGCAAPASTVLPTSAKQGFMSVKGAISVKSAKAFQLKSLVTQNDESTLARIEVWLARDGGKATSLGDLDGTARSVTLNNLKLDSTYTVTLKGFKDDPNTEGVDSDLPISEDALSVVEFNTNADDSGAYQSEKEVSFALKLNDQTFAGQASGNIDLTTGDLTSTDAEEALVVAAPSLPDATGMVYPLFVRHTGDVEYTLIDAGAVLPPEIVGCGFVPDFGEFGDALNNGATILVPKYTLSCGD